VHPARRARHQNEIQSHSHLSCQSIDPITSSVWTHLPTFHAQFIHWLMTFSLHRMPNCSILDVNVFLLASGEISFVCLCPLIRANLVLSILHSFPFCQKLVLVRSLNRGHKLNRTELHDIVNGVDREATPLGPPATPRMTQGFVRRMLEEELDVLADA
jgi:hypothetical protein